MHTPIFTRTHTRDGKDDKVVPLWRICVILPSKFTNFSHIFEVNFDCKCIKFMYIIIFIMENLIAFNVFSVKPLTIQENRVKMSISGIFRIKGMKKWHARKSVLTEK